MNDLSHDCVGNFKVDHDEDSGTLFDLDINPTKYGALFDLNIKSSEDLNIKLTNSVTDMVFLLRIVGKEDYSRNWKRHIAISEPLTVAYL